MIARSLTILTKPITWGILALVLFLSLLSPWLQPGSGVQTLTATLALGTEAQLETFAPLSEMIYRAVLWVLPPSMTVQGLNVVTAFFGAINVCLVGLMLQYMIAFFYNKTPSESATVKAQRWAVPFAAIVLLSQPDYLYACTHFQPQVFKQFFVMGALTLTAWALKREQAWPSFVATLVVSLVMLECKETLLISPILLIVLLLGYYLYVGHIRPEIVFFNFLLPIGVGLMAFFGCAMLTPAGFLSYAPKALVLLHGYELVQLISVPGWILILFFGIVPCLVLGAIFQRSNTNHRTIEFLVIYFFASLLALFALLPTRFHPLNLLRNSAGESCPILMMGLMALSIGFLIALTIAIRAIRRFSEGGEENKLVRYCVRKLAKGILFTSIPLIVIVAGYNIYAAHQQIKSADGLTRAATMRVIEHLGNEESWLIDQHPLMPYLLIARYEANGGLDHLHFFLVDDIINETAFVNQHTLKRFSESIANSERIKTLLTPKGHSELIHYSDMGGLVCLREMIRRNPETIKTIYTLSSSALWNLLHQENWYGMSLWDGVLYRAMAEGEKPRLLAPLALPALPSAKALKEARKAFIQPVQPANATIEFIQSLSRQDYNNHMLSAATLALHQDESVQAMAVDHLKAAYGLNQERVQLIHDNLVHYLARYRVPVPGAFTGYIDPVVEEIKTTKGKVFTFDEAEYEHHLRWLKLYFVFRPYEDYVFKIENAVARGERDIYKMMQKTTPHNINLTPQSMQVNRLTVELKTALSTGDLTTAEARLKELEMLSTPEMLGYLRALYLNMAGRGAEALEALEAYLEQNSKDLDAVALLATIQLERKQFDLVEVRTLPRLISIAGTEDNYNVKIIQAQFLNHKGQLHDARACFNRALELRPNATNIRDAILTLDMRLNDRDAAAQHAQSFITFDPSYPFANYILGSIALSKGEMTRAQHFLELASIHAAKPLAMAYNDLAELRRLQGDNEIAHTYAQRAIELQPTLTIAYETAASSLIALKRYEEAEASLSKAEQQPGTQNDARIALTRVRLYLATQRIVEARAIMARLRNALHLLDRSARQDYDKLLEELSKEP